MSDHDRDRQIPQAVEIYEHYFLPALFQEWVDRVADAARVEPGQRVLDVACGTGVLARGAAARVGASGAVVGLDPDTARLAMAARKAPDIRWVRGVAEALPFADGSFDAVVSQFGMMFFTDPVTALREMKRVLRPQGRAAVAVWDSLERTPGYAVVTDLLERLFGSRIADLLRVRFRMGDPAVLRALFAAAGFSEVEIATLEGTARFPSIASWVATDVRGWLPFDLVEDDDFARLAEQAEAALRPFVGADGAVTFRSPAHIVMVVKGVR